MLSYCSDGFEELVGKCFSHEELERHTGTVFGLWKNFELAYFNPAWNSFAENNDGQPLIASNWNLGSRYFDAIPPVLHDFYLKLFSSAPEPGTSQYPVVHQYECSSADVFRKFNMQIHALPENAGFIIVNSLVVEIPHDKSERKAHSPEVEKYTDSAGIIHQCCHCRRTKNINTANTWDWVPSWVLASPNEASHTICNVCFNYYYPEK